MSEHINKFIQKQTCASVCCIDGEGKPYCFTCFYAFEEENKVLYFKSGEGSYHSKLMLENPFVAATILPDKLKTLLVQGIQLEGIILNEDHPLMKKASAIYHKKHPMALAMTGKIWGLQINHMKMTDSNLGFGKKITWQRETEAV